jgi:hypothetical protein
VNAPNTRRREIHHVGPCRRKKRPDGTLIEQIQLGPWAGDDLAITDGDQGSHDG